MRFLVMFYGLFSYACFAVVLAYFIAFVAGVYVPVSLATAADSYSPYAGLINVSLLLLWGVQHSVMARSWFKDIWVSQAIERSTYVLASTVVLALLMYCWQPMEGELWQLENSLLIGAVWVVFGLGWVLTVFSTFLTNHFDLFGLRQSWLYFINKPYLDVSFTESVFYHWIRHPMMLGLLISFWFVPSMSYGHFVFSIGMTIYIFIGIHFEEKGLARDLGEQYEQYQKVTKKVIPKLY